MIEKTQDQVNIVIDENKLVKAMALLQDMKDFCLEQHEEGVSETDNALTVAIETMSAFYC